MPRNIVTPPVKGTRIPGSGRKKGQPNRISVEVKTLVGQLVNDVAYQQRLREDFRRRRVHPTIESLIWQYHLGKPKQTIDLDLTATLDVRGRIEDERRAFAMLDLAEMEQLAADSQALVDRAFALSRSRMDAPTPQDVVVDVIGEDEPSKTLGNSAGSDNPCFVNSTVDPPKTSQLP